MQINWELLDGTKNVCPYKHNENKASQHKWLFFTKMPRLEFLSHPCVWQLTLYSELSQPVTWKKGKIIIAKTCRWQFGELVSNSPDGSLGQNGSKIWDFNTGVSQFLVPESCSWHGKIGKSCYARKKKKNKQKKRITRNCRQETLIWWDGRCKVCQYGKTMVK